MTLRNLMTILAGATALIVAAFATSGCGSSGGRNARSPTPPKTENGKSATIGVANEDVGNILVDAQGRTLYLFERDSTSKSACTGPCSVQWPPLLADSKPTVGRGANPSLVAISVRSDGKAQVTYNGHPVYLFFADHEPGDTYGQAINAFGGRWYVVSSSGNPVTPQAPSNRSGY